MVVGAEKPHRLQLQHIRVSVIALTFASRVILGKLLNLSGHLLSDPSKGSHHQLAVLLQRKYVSLVEIQYMAVASVASLPISIPPFFLTDRISILFRAAAYLAKKILISQRPLSVRYPSDTVLGSQKGMSAG